MASSTEENLSLVIEALEEGKQLEAENLLVTILQDEPTHPEANYQLGLLAVKDGYLEESLPLFLLAIQSDPEIQKFWVSYIEVLIKLKRNSAAKEVLKDLKKTGLEGKIFGDLEALANDLEREPSPDYVKSLFDLFDQGRFQDLLDKLESLLQKFPDSAPLYNLEGLANSSLEKYESAAESYRKVIKIKPDIAEVHLNLGQALAKSQRPDEAIDSYKEALRIKTDYAEAHNNWGRALFAKGQYNDAIAQYRQAIKFNPHYAIAYYNMGQAQHTKAALYKQEDEDWNLEEFFAELDNVLFSFNQAIEINPAYAEAHFKVAQVFHDKLEAKLGNELQDQALLGKAEESLKLALTIKPKYAEAHYTMGVTLQKAKNLKAAQYHFAQAIEIEPDYVDALNNLGAILSATLNYEEAEKVLRRAVTLKSDHVPSRSNLGDVLRSQSQLKGSLEAYDEALALGLRTANLLLGKATTLAYMSDFEEVVSLHEQIMELAKQEELSRERLSIIWEVRLYVLIYHPNLSAEEICEEHKKWGNRYLSLGQDGFPDHDRSLKRRLKIGYVSPDFKEHTCRFYFDPLFSSHNKEEVELFAYSNVLREDEHTDRMRSYFDEWRDIRDMSDESAAQKIREDKIDILVDGCGHMGDARLEIFAHKPAPIQVTWLGAAWTTGLPQMDYVFFDEYMAPEGTPTSEEIVRLPRTWAAFRPGTKALNCDVKPLPALKNDYVTFGYSGRTERLNNKVFRVWGKILKRVPTAQLILDFKSFADDKTRDYYEDFLKCEGVDTSRVLMRCSTNIFEALGDIDILLDSFPHSGGTMLFDALWMGVPAVTLASSRPVGRIGASLMSNLGLPNWVAQDDEEYEEKAVSFACDVSALSELRSTMRQRMQDSPVMDEDSFARDVEKAYQEMWQKWITTK